MERNRPRYGWAVAHGVYLSPVIDSGNEYCYRKTLVVIVNWELTVGGGYLIYLDRPTLRKLSRWICFVLQSTAKSNFALFCLRGVSWTMSI